MPAAQASRRASFTGFWWKERPTLTRVVQFAIVGSIFFLRLKIGNPWLRAGAAISITLAIELVIVMIENHFRRPSAE